MTWLLFPQKSYCGTLHRTPGISYYQVKKRMSYQRQVIVNTLGVRIFWTSTVYINWLDLEIEKLKNPQSSLNFIQTSRLLCKLLR